MFKVGDRVTVYSEKIPYNGTIMATNVKEVPVPGLAEPYKFDEERYAILSDEGNITYPKMNDNHLDICHE